MKNIFKTETLMLHFILWGGVFAALLICPGYTEGTLCITTGSNAFIFERESIQHVCSVLPPTLLFRVRS